MTCKLTPCVETAGHVTLATVALISGIAFATAVFAGAPTPASASSQTSSVASDHSRMAAMMTSCHRMMADAGHAPA
jgi:hypothetical protein